MRITTAHPGMVVWHRFNDITGKWRDYPVNRVTILQVYRRDFSAYVAGEHWGSRVPLSTLSTRRPK